MGRFAEKESRSFPDYRLPETVKEAADQVSPETLSHWVCVACARMMVRYNSGSGKPESWCSP